MYIYIYIYVRDVVLDGGVDGEDDVGDTAGVEDPEALLVMNKSFYIWFVS